MGRKKRPTDEAAAMRFEDIGGLNCPPRPPSKAPTQPEIVSSVNPLGHWPPSWQSISASPHGSLYRPSPKACLAAHVETWRYSVVVFWTRDFRWWHPMAPIGLFLSTIYIYTPVYTHVYWVPRRLVHGSDTAPSHRQSAATANLMQSETLHYRLLHTDCFLNDCGTQTAS